MTGLEEMLSSLAHVLKFVLEAAALFAVVCGLIGTAVLAVHLVKVRPVTAFADLRIRFGSWLAIALEFQLGADIVATTVQPSAEALVALGVIALIRTFLNYFLGRELAEQAKLKRELCAPDAGSR